MAALGCHPVKTATLRTKLGPLTVHYTPRGVTRLEFGAATRAPVTPLPTFVNALAEALENYATGNSTAFKIPIHFDSGTDFQKKVWRTLRTIPHGQTRSYAWVARQIGHPRSARAVGAACGANPVLILVPCHRVIAADGALGGFSSGLHRKRQLLRLEQAPVS